MSYRAFASLLLAALSAQAAPSLKLTIGGDSNPTGVDSFNVKTTLTNTGDQDLTLYNDPRGVLSNMPTKSFKLHKSSSPDDQPAFIGAVAKYVFESATSFTNLAVGQSVTVEHQLANAYDFTSTGEYTVAPVTRFFYKAEDGTPTPIDAELEQPHTAKLGGNLKSRHVEKRRKRHAEKRATVEEREINAKWSNKKRAENESLKLWKRQTSFANCTSAQETQIQASTYVASLYVADAEKFLTLNDKSTPRFEQWFGSFEEDHRNTVLTHYTNIRSTDVKTYTYDCACTEGDDVFAYVFPDEFGHIYLCAQYMAAEISGTDSKAGTIVHESSHFTRNAGTLDIAYGQERAGALAQTNSSEAIMNADSHEYFAENNPFLQ